MLKSHEGQQKPIAKRWRYHRHSKTVESPVRCCAVESCDGGEQEKARRGERQGGRSGRRERRRRRAYPGPPFAGERGERMMQDRRAAPVSKVFTIPAKNKVQRPERSFSRRNWQQKAESPSAHSLPTMGVRHALSPGEEGPQEKRDRKRKGERDESRNGARGVVFWSF
ncbi:uncharacterized protein LOC143354591 [Halictus rubicundus]|uniref:uncharacterized protein LOC143354591 n=1 Tax=Halictus rubicundus TaxID=77578 RepID=UPI004036281D